MKSLSTTIQMKATWQYFSVVPLTMLYKVVLTFLSVKKTPKFYVKAMPCEPSFTAFSAVKPHISPS